MINFIICEDIKKYRTMVKNIITKYMMKNEFDYEVHVFEDYNNSFIDAVNSKMPFKIYILDIELPSGSGIDIARIIRNRDVDSVIIFLSGHQELTSVVSKKQFAFLTFINKFDNCENILMKAIDKSLQMLKIKNMLKFKDSGTVYTIDLNDVLYITTSSVERKTIIKTDYTEFKTNKSLNELKEMLTVNFVQTHRSCIVNKQRVVSYNKPKRQIKFDNNEEIDLISIKFEEELI